MIVRRVAVATFVVCGVAWPFAVGGFRGYGLGTTAAITVLLALGYQVTYGFSGQLSVAHAPLQGAGAYTVARLMTSAGWSFWVALPAGVAVAAALGAVVGLPGLRVRGDVLALVTLGAGEILQSVYLNATSLTGGYQGVSGVPRVEWFGHRLDDRDLYLVALGLVVLALLAVIAIRASPLGRALFAIRDDEDAARALGVRPAGLRLTAFAVGAGIAGAAGGVYAVQNGFVSSVSFGLAQTVPIILIALVAGEGRVGRTVVVAIVYIALVDRLATVGDVSEGITGAIILLVVAFRLGLIANAVRWSRRSLARALP